MNVERNVDSDSGKPDNGMHPEYIDEDLHSRQLAVYGRDSM